MSAVPGGSFKPCEPSGRRGGSTALKSVYGDVVSKQRATYRGVFLNRSSCWWCDRPLGETYTSVESRTGFPLFVHFHCQPEAESITWPGRFA